MNPIQLTKDFRMNYDGKMNVIIERRRVVDPTKAVGYKADSGIDVTLREEYGDPKFFSVSANGIASALEYVATRTALEREINTLQELAYEIRSAVRQLTDMINASTSLGFTVKLDD